MKEFQLIRTSPFTWILDDNPKIPGRNKWTFTQHANSQETENTLIKVTAVWDLAHGESSAVIWDEETARAILDAFVILRYRHPMSRQIIPLL